MSANQKNYAINGSIESLASESSKRKKRRRKSKRRIRRKKKNKIKIIMNTMDVAAMNRKSSTVPDHVYIVLLCQ